MLAESKILSKLKLSKLDAAQFTKLAFEHILNFQFNMFLTIIDNGASENLPVKVYDS